LLIDKPVPLTTYWLSSCNEEVEPCGFWFENVICEGWVVWDYAESVRQL